MTNSDPSSDPISALLQGRRSAHQFLVGCAPVCFALREDFGGPMLTPPTLPAAAGAKPIERLTALATDEATRLDHAELFTFDPAATSAAISYGARLQTSAAMDGIAAPGATIAGHGIVPPAPAGFLRWATPVNPPGSQTPIIGMHWGRITTPETSGTWLVFWGDLPALLGDGLADASAPAWLTPQLADDMLAEHGPLYYDNASFLKDPDGPQAPHTAADPAPATFPFTYLRTLPPAPTAPPAPQCDPDDTLTYIVLASWAMLTPDPAQPAPPPHLARRTTPAHEAEADRRAGLPPARQITLVTAPALRPIDPLPAGLDDAVHHLRMRVYAMVAPDAPDGPTPDEVIADLLLRYEAEVVMMAAYLASRQILEAAADQGRASRAAVLTELLNVLTPAGQFPAEGMPFDGQAWTALEHLLLPPNLETTLPPPGITPTDLLWALGTFQSLALMHLAENEHRNGRSNHQSATRTPTARRTGKPRKKRR